MAGKGLKEVTALNKCSACGHVKRAHLLCPYCVKGALFLEVIKIKFTYFGTEIQNMFKGKTAQSKTTADKEVDK